MKFKNIIIALGLLTFIASKSNAQSGNETTAYSSFVFYYVDNSEEYGDPLNAEVAQQLIDNLKDENAHSGSYFFLYACNGEEPKIWINNLASKLSAEKYKDILDNPLKDSEYDYDLHEIRNTLSDEQMKIRYKVQINMYLSSSALKKLTKPNMSQLPAPVVLPDELLLFLKNTELKTSINIYINNQIASKIDENKIKSYFTFCNSELNLSERDVNIIPL